MNKFPIVCPHVSIFYKLSLMYQAHRINHGYYNMYSNTGYINSYSAVHVSLLFIINTGMHVSYSDNTTKQKLKNSNNK